MRFVFTCPVSCSSLRSIVPEEKQMAVRIRQTLTAETGCVVFQEPVLQLQHHDYRQYPLLHALRARAPSAPSVPAGRSISTGHDPRENQWPAVSLFRHRHRPVFQVPGGVGDDEINTCFRSTGLVYAVRRGCIMEYHSE